MGQFTRACSSSSSSSVTICTLFLLLLVSRCDGARSMRGFKESEQQELAVTGRRSSAGHFLGFLPRATPVPPSGPSRQHNSIGPENRGWP